MLYTRDQDYHETIKYDLRLVLAEAYFAELFRGLSCNNRNSGWARLQFLL